MIFDRPPYSAIIRVCRRSYHHPDEEKRAPVEMPWFNCCTMLPVMPTGVRANMPSMTMPMWLTLEYATSASSRVAPSPPAPRR